MTIARCSCIRGNQARRRFVSSTSRPVENCRRPFLTDADSVRVLRDGRIVAVRSGHVLVYSGTKLLRDIAINSPSPRVETERSPGKIVLWDLKPREMSFTVDVDSGAVIGTAEGLTRNRIR